MFKVDEIKNDNNEINAIIFKLDPMSLVEMDIDLRHLNIYDIMIKNNT